MKVVRFLAAYFKPYMPQLFGALLAALVYAFASGLGLVVFQVILSDVVLTDQTVGEAFGVPAPEADDGGGAAMEGEGEDGVGEDGRWSWLPFDLDSLDLHQILMDGYESLKTAFGITEETVVYFVPLLLVLVITSRSIARFVNGYLFQVVGLGATNDLRNDLYDRILRQSSRFYSRHPSGELLSRVGNDITVVQNAVSTRFVDFFQQVPTFIITIWILVSLNFELALVLFFVAPAIALPIVRFGKGMRRTSHKSQERLADLSNLVAESVRGHRVVKAFGSEAFELARFRKAAWRHLRVKLKAQMLTYASGPVIETLAAIGAGAFLVYAGRAVRAEQLEASDLVTFLVGSIALYDPIRKLNKVNLALQEALAAAQRVESVMLEENEIVDAPDASELAPLRQEIHFEQVSFAYKDQTVLHGIELRIRAGEVVALVGKSGAGKSTLVNLLPRFFDPSSGTVRIDGIDIRGATLDSLRAQIGLVTQDTVLFNDSVRNNIAYGASEAPQDAVEAAARAAFADDFVRQLDGGAGYDTVLGESGEGVSGGQRQRLAIARALLKDPPILILDEATSQLDTEAESLVQQALANLMSGRTALVIAHRLSTIQRADRILVMDKGRIVEEGKHDELLRQGGIYKHLYDLQFRDE
ncbi:MAG: ABC transporter ATP-binding protein [Acidobacteriota bacterium]